VYLYDYNKLLYRVNTLYKSWSVSKIRNKDWYISQAHFKRFFRFLSQYMQKNQGFSMVQQFSNLVHRVRRYRNFRVLSDLTKISIYLRRFFSAFFGLYLSICRKFRAFQWSNNHPIRSTGSGDIAIFVFSVIWWQRLELLIHSS